MLLGRASVRGGHRVKEERAGSKIDNGRAGDAQRINVSGACKITCQHRRAKVALPNDAAIDRVKRVHIIRFGDRNDHWAVWTALDVKRLGINVAYDRPVEV